MNTVLRYSQPTRRLRSPAQHRGPRTDRRDWIRLSRFSFECVLGILSKERDKAQRLDVALSMRLDLQPAATGDLRRSVDYGDILQQVQFIAQQGHWPLLESMAHALALHLLMPPFPGEPRARIEEVIVRLAKPEALNGQAVPSVEIRREKADRAQPSSIHISEGTRAAVLNETEESGAYHVTLAPGGAWMLPPLASALILAGETAVDGQLRNRLAAVEAGELCCAQRADVGLLVAAKKPLSGDWQ